MANLNVARALLRRVLGWLRSLRTPDPSLALTEELDALLARTRPDRLPPPAMLHTLYYLAVRARNEGCEPIVDRIEAHFEQWREVQ